MPNQEIKKLSRSAFVQSILKLNGKPYSLKDYPHMVLPYDIDPDEMVLHFSRQCVYENQVISLANGTPVLAKNLKPGMVVNSFNVDLNKVVNSKIKDVWPNGLDDVYEIKTESGKSAIVNYKHPIWTKDGWTKAGELSVGTEVAVISNNSFSTASTLFVHDNKYKLAAYILSLGYVNKHNYLTLSKTAKPFIPIIQKLLKELLPNIAIYYNKQYKKYVFKYIEKLQPFESILSSREYILDHLRLDKSLRNHPQYIWDLNKIQLSKYIAIWFDTSMVLNKDRKNHYSIIFSTYSKSIVKGLQQLLLKIGISSSYYKNKFKTFVKNKPRLKTSVHGVIITDINKDNFLINIPYNSNKYYSTFSGNITRYFNAIRDKLKKDQNYHFEKIKSVTKVGRLPIISIEIEDTHTFAIDNIITKNTSKSVTLAGRMVGDAIAINHLKQMYVSPTVDQTTLFSNDRIKPFIETSDFIRKYYLDTRLAQNIFTKQFKNFSKLYLRYALHDADRLRGFTIDKLYFDEVQDLRANVIDVVAETMSRSDYKKTIYAGTPKRSKGTLANIWSRSTKNEYVIKCGSCGHWNILGEKNIGKSGVICSKCGSYDMKLSEGRWVSTYSLSDSPSVIGFRICALHFSNAPWVDWQRDIIKKMETRSKQLFYNETLALEYDGGSVPITEEKLRKLCSNKRMNDFPEGIELSYNSISGIDYGPENSDKSNTVFVSVQRRTSYYEVVFAKKFLGKEAKFTYIHKEVPRLVKVWKSSILASDYGMGEASNGEIREALDDAVLIPFQHTNGQRELVRWNKKLKAYTINRTQAMSLLFNALNAGKIKFPNKLDMEPFFKDILNIYAEYDDELGTLKYFNSGPDDFFHALLYTIMSYEMTTDNKLIFI